MPIQNSPYYLEDKTCNLEIEYLVLYQYEQMNRLDIVYSLGPRDLHRLSSSLLQTDTLRKWEMLYAWLISEVYDS